MDQIPSSTVVIKVGPATPAGRKGVYVRFADGIMAKLDGTSGTWEDAFPTVEWNQNGGRFDALADYSTSKIAATKKMAEGD